MKKIMSPLLIALVTIGLVSCSSSSDSDSASDTTQAATESTEAGGETAEAGGESATPGDAFCVAAAEASAASKADIGTTSEEVEANFTEITRLNNVALEAAPADIKDALTTMLSAFDSMNAVFAANNYDLTAPDVLAAASSVGAPGTPEATASAEVKDYLAAHCDIPQA